MKKENIALRFFGFSLLAIGIYWLLNYEFVPYPLFGVIPIPSQFILIILGFFLGFIPATFLNILSYIIFSDEKGEKIRKFIQEYLGYENSNATKISPDDDGQILADKLNRAIGSSKRRYYLFWLISLIIFPLITIYLINNNENKINKVKMEDLIIKAVQNKQIEYSQHMEFNLILKDTIKIKELKKEDSSVRCLYDILEQLYSDDVKNNEDFKKKIEEIYASEVKNKFNFGEGAFNINAINAPDSDSKHIHRQTLYLLLAIICNKNGKDGENLAPYLYERGFLNEILAQDTIPNVAYNLDGVSSVGLLKNKEAVDNQKYEELKKSVFPQKFPSQATLATNAKIAFEKYNKKDNTSSLALARFYNNFTDLYITCIHLIKLEGKSLKGPDDSNSELIDELNSNDLTATFKKLMGWLESAQGAKRDVVTLTTMAQIYSLEGEVKEKVNPNWCTLTEENKEWCSKQRKAAVRAISSAVDNGRSVDIFENKRRYEAYLNWLWEDDKTGLEIQQIIDDRKKSDKKNIQNDKEK